MKTISTTSARKEIAKLIDHVREHDSVFAIGRRNQPEALLIKFPSEYNKEVSDITNINAYSGSFDFLHDEPDLYSENDLKVKYA